MKASDCIKGNQVKVVNGARKGATGTFISRTRTPSCYVIAMKLEDGTKIHESSGHVQLLRARKSQYVGKLGRPMTAK
jgi:hypothetical protein